MGAPSKEQDAVVAFSAAPHFDTIVDALEWYAPGPSGRRVLMKVPPLDRTRDELSDAYLAALFERLAIAGTVTARLAILSEKADDQRRVIRQLCHCMPEESAGLAVKAHTLLLEIVNRWRDQIHDSACAGVGGFR